MAQQGQAGVPAQAANPAAAGPSSASAAGIGEGPHAPSASSMLRAQAQCQAMSHQVCHNPLSWKPLTPVRVVHMYYSALSPAW